MWHKTIFGSNNIYIDKNNTMETTIKYVNKRNVELLVIALTFDKNS